MRLKFSIVFLLLLALPLAAKKPVAEEPMLTAEQEQQFTYYWYAAKQAVEQGRYADGLVMLEFCRLIKPDDGQTLTFLAIMYDAMGQKERAMQTYQLAFEADPRDQWNRYAYALEQQRTQEGYEEALKVLEKAYAAQKGKDKKRETKVDEDLLEQLRRMYLRNFQWAKSITIQDEIDRIKGFDAYSAVNRYHAYISRGKIKKAFEALDRYLELDPNHVQILLMRMELMERTGVKQQDLYAMYERILSLDPGNLLVLNNYAYRLATGNGDLQKAERMSAITIREEPSNPVYLDTYGWILHKQGQDELALFYLQRALSNISKPGAVKMEIEHHLRIVKGEK